MSTPAFTFDNTLGAMVAGFAVSCVVYGVLLTQVWTYFWRYNGDGVTYKFLVVLILLLETVAQVFIGHFVYFYTVTSIQDPFSIIKGTTTWSVILQEAIGSVVGTIVKCCFASRVYRFSEKNIFITGLIVLLALGQLGVSAFFTVKAFMLTHIAEVFNLRNLGTISLALGVATDIVTAAALCFFLSRLRTGHREADSLVSRLVTDAINTGVVTSAVSLATLLMFNFSQHNLIFIGIYFVLSKLYAISFLATLNTRRVVRGRGTDQEYSTTRRTATELAQQETNMFHLGTRLPALDDERRLSAYSAFDLKPGFPPHQPSASHHQQQNYAY
ncbi:hypothetical protein C8J57DRAFT_335947 [Mycena rebaudengoi]|nr:hypothetical protein C8J57DRAFT_335947 [Mycena rebaudengoi]